MLTEIYLSRKNSIYRKKTIIIVTYTKEHVSELVKDVNDQLQVVQHGLFSHHDYTLAVRNAVGKIVDKCQDAWFPADSIKPIDDATCRLLNILGLRFIKPEQVKEAFSNVCHAVSNGEKELRRTYP